MGKVQGSVPVGEKPSARPGAGRPVVLAGVDADGKVRALQVSAAGKLLAPAAASTPTLAAVVAEGNSAANHRITNLTDPSGAQDADTKAARSAAIAARIISGTVDPSAGLGVAAALGVLYARTDAGNVGLWMKTGAAATGWQPLVFA